MQYTLHGNSLYCVQLKMQRLIETVSKKCIFSSPEHKVLMVSYIVTGVCPSSVVVRRASSFVRRP